MNIHGLIILMMIFNSLVASTAKQMVSICYFDHDKAQFDIPRIPNFIRGREETSVDRGYMLFYERKMLDILSVFSFYGGVNMGRYHKNEDTLYSGSLALSTRFWIMHLVLLHPYVEASFFGPTILSKSEFDLKNFKSNFLLQNTLSVGAEVGSGSGLCIELKAVKYFKANLIRREHPVITVPLYVSLGYLF